MKSFNHRQFTLRKLINIKNQRGITVGLALPVFNEEKNIWKTIKIAKKCGSLIDELMVFDSGSSDKSRRICKKLKVKVIDDKKVAKDLGISLQKGKGWNLWASLYYLSTDLIIWIDSDIKNIDTRFITGIIGPMLIDPKIKFVKGYYRRPKGDARITEIMVRPFINLIFPKLKDFIQPLSGEYGGRREFLEKIFFYSGYSVEVAVLIQAVYNLRGNEIAQSYLDKRIHKLSSLLYISRMSASIMYTLFDIAEKMSYLKTLRKISHKIQQYTYNNYFQPKSFNIADKKLPPMIIIRKYIKKFEK